MAESLPVVLVPGLNCSPRLYAAQLAALWRFGPVTVADHTRDDTMASIAGRILDAAPPRFALAGLSMGGYIALEIMRQAADRVTRLALLDTGSRADTPEATAKRHTNIARAQAGQFEDVIGPQFRLYVHPSRAGDAALKAEYLAMCHEVGPQAYVRQQRAIMARLVERGAEAIILGCTEIMLLVGAEDSSVPLFDTTTLHALAAVDRALTDDTSESTSEP